MCQVYGEEFGLPTADEKIHHEDSKKDSKLRNRKVSDQTSTQASPVRRKDSVTKKDRYNKYNCIVF